MRSELPAKQLSERREGYVREHRLPHEVASIVTMSHAHADYFESVAAAADGDYLAAANWFSTEVLRRLNADGIDLAAPSDVPLDPARLGTLIRLIRKGTISGKAAKEVFEEIFEGDADPEEVVRARGLEQISDEGAIREAIEKVISASPDQLARYRSGKTTLLGYFVGQVMKATGGRANPGLVNRLLSERLAGSGEPDGE